MKLKNLIWLIAVASFAMLPVMVAFGDEPVNATLNLRGKVSEVYDGDTATIRFTIDVRVRLLDCWAPEIRTIDQAEKKAGLASKKNLQQMSEGKDCILSIPLSGVTRLDDIFTFGRVLGWVFVDGKDVSKEQVLGGFATKNKQQKREAELDQ